MRSTRVLIAVAVATAIPALAQYSSSSSSTISQNGATVQQSTVTSAGVATSITGGTGNGTVSSSGVVVNPQQDQMLMQQIVAQLSTNPAIAGAQIDVQVVGGRVTLNGLARSQSQVEAAKDIAANIAGGGANIASNLTSDRQ